MSKEGANKLHLLALATAAGIRPEGLHCTQGHFVPYFGPATWFWVGDAKFCMQCIVERVVPFLDSLGVGRVVEDKVKDKGARPPSHRGPV